MRTVWFTAWKYDRQDALWRSLILRVLDALYPREDGEGLREERPVLQNPTDPGQIKLIELLEKLEETVYQAVEWEEAGRSCELTGWQFGDRQRKGGAEGRGHRRDCGGRRALRPRWPPRRWRTLPVEDVQEAAEAFSRETQGLPPPPAAAHGAVRGRLLKEAVRLIGRRRRG